MPKHRHEAEITFAVRKVFSAVTSEEPAELIEALKGYGLYIVHDDELEDLQSEMEDLVGVRAKKFKEIIMKGNE